MSPCTVRIDLPSRDTAVPGRGPHQVCAHARDTPVIRRGLGAASAVVHVLQETLEAGLGRKAEVIDTEDVLDAA